MADYQVKLESGKLSIGGQACSVSPYGVAMVHSLGLNQAVQDAITYLIGHQYYANVLSHWGVQAGAITASAVSVNDNNSVGSSCVPSY